MNIRSIIIYGKPLGKKRPKTTTIHGKAKQYTPIETINYEVLIKNVYDEKYKGKPLFIEALFSEIMIYKLIPSSISEKKKQLMEEGIIRPTNTPDIDNVEKIVKDALNQIAYIDDKQFVESSTRAYYSYQPRVEFTFGEL